MSKNGKILAGVRKLDALGRVVIPSDIRAELNINENDKLVIELRQGNIIIDKFRNNCHCCDNEAEHIVLGIKLCNKCLKQFEEYRELINKCRG